ncbi:hypothetical protein TNCV_2095621 [Trichonephila clavipes]|nr:hypothetical protein TNCV_2095621 [Trichonephila clavipes]
MPRNGRFKCLENRMPHLLRDGLRHGPTGPRPSPSVGGMYMTIQRVTLKCERWFDSSWMGSKDVLDKPPSSRSSVIAENLGKSTDGQVSLSPLRKTEYPSITKVL